MTRLSANDAAREDALANLAYAGRIAEAAAIDPTDEESIANAGYAARMVSDAEATLAGLI